MINQKSKIHHRIHVPIYDFAIVRAFFFFLYVFIVLGTMLFIARKNNLLIVLLDVATRYTALGAWIKAIGNHQLNPGRLALVFKIAAKASKQRTVYAFRSNVAHKHALDVQILNADCIIFSDKVSRVLVYCIILHAVSMLVKLLKLDST